MQDAAFIAADPDHAKADKPRGDTAQTRRNKEGTWAKKGGRSYFGYKLHSKVDIDYGLIRDVFTTTASVHDSRVDLSRPGEVVYRDSGYFGVKSKGYDAAGRSGPLSQLARPAKKQAYQPQANSCGTPLRCHQDALQFRTRPCRNACKDACQEHVCVLLLQSRPACQAPPSGRGVTGLA